MFVRKIKYNERSVAVAVIGSHDREVSLLSGDIEQIELDVFLADLNLFRCKVDSHSH